MKLTDTACRNAKPQDKAYKKADGGGLYLHVKPNGAKYWRLKYYFLGKEKLLALGVYPIVSLQEARVKRDSAKKLLDAGEDPNTVKKERKRQTIKKHKNTFKVVALEWHEKQQNIWSANHAQNVNRRFEVDIFPYIGTRPITDIDPPELLEVLRRIEKRGSLDVAARVKQICGQVFRYGIAIVTKLLTASLPTRTKAKSTVPMSIDALKSVKTAILEKKYSMRKINLDNLARKSPKHSLRSLFDQYLDNYRRGFLDKRCILALTVRTEAICKYSLAAKPDNK